MALGDDIAVLAHSELFSQFDENALRLLAFSAERRMLKAGDILFSKGDRSDGGYIVKRGAVRLNSDDRRKFVAVGPGALIGRVALFIRNIRPVTAIATEPTDLIYISQSLMHRVLEEFPFCAEVAREVIMEDLEDLAEGLEQILQALETEAKTESSVARIQLPPSLLQVSSEAGIGRQGE